ncbi:MAG: FIST C-terminal domain-containing protein [Elusimicrobia bacterium]|nr:FIST C-terminal domain-containing protein [Elusimicrobiota bacterium]
MRIAIGLGSGPDAGRAARQAACEARKTVPEPDLAIAFGSIYLDQKEVHEALRAELGPAALVGGSSYREITNAGVTRGTVAVLLLSLEGARASLATADSGPEPYSTGLALAKGLARPSDPGLRPLGLVFASVASGYENEMLRALAMKLGRMPFFGGLCCGDYDLGMSHPDFWTNYQYAGPKLMRQTASMALLELPREIEPCFGFSHGWQPVGPAVRLTKASGAKVYEVDGVPVFDYYRQFLGGGQSDAFFELLVQRYAFALEDEGSPYSVVKLPVACDFKEGCITYYPAEDLQGRSVRLIQASRRALLEGAREAALRLRAALAGRKPDLVFMVSCCARASILHSVIGRELEVVQEILGREVPLFGFYSGGEIAPPLSRYDDVVSPDLPMAGSCYHVTTVGLMALCSPKPAVSSFPAPALMEEADPGREAERLRKLLARSEEILDSTESFLSNLSRKSYQDAERLRKQNEVIHRYTPHEVWKEVGRRADRGEYELPDAEFNGAFLFMDVKGFTSFSEEHEAAEVVRRLNEIFGPAADVIYSCGGDVDKYIGDCIFAAFRDAGAAVQAGLRILRLLTDLKARGSPFTVRVGVNAGRAVRANVGSGLRREYTFIGDAVNLAQRLESACTPGKLLMSEAVFKQAGGLPAPGVVGAGVPPRSRLDSGLPGAPERREVAVKGKKAPVVAYEVGPAP